MNMTWRTAGCSARNRTLLDGHSQIRTLSDSTATMYLCSGNYDIHFLSLANADEMFTYLSSVVMCARVTMAPRALYASLSMSLPVRTFQTPTHPRVTVTATATAWHKLRQMESSIQWIVYISINASSLPDWVDVDVPHFDCAINRWGDHLQWLTTNEQQMHKCMAESNATWTRYCLPGVRMLQKDTTMWT